MLVENLRRVPETRRPISALKSLSLDLVRMLQRGDRAELAEVRAVLSGLSLEGEAGTFVSAWLEAISAAQEVARQEADKQAVRAIPASAVGQAVLPLLSEGWLRQSDLVKRSGRHKSEISRFIDKLEVYDLVEVRTSPGDGRVNEVRLTPAGAHLLANSKVDIGVPLAQVVERVDRAIGSFDWTEVPASNQGGRHRIRLVVNDVVDALHQRIVRSLADLAHSPAVPWSASADRGSESRLVIGSFQNVQPGLTYRPTRHLPGGHRRRQRGEVEEESQPL